MYSKSLSRPAQNYSMMLNFYRMKPALCRMQLKTNLNHLSYNLIR